MTHSSSRPGDDGEARSALSRCLALKGGASVSVVIPALNEASTVGGVVEPVVRLVSEGLVDEVVLVDGGSTDETCERAGAAGARVVNLADVMDVQPHPGKGGGLWAGVRSTTGDLVLFLDADVAPFHSDWVPTMLHPLLARPDVQLVKGCYERPVGRPDARVSGRGGRVTELLARPLLAVLWPELRHLRQPLAGETAARRTLLEDVPFATGYGVEIGLLIDTYVRCGAAAIEQVDLGERWHAPQDDEVLSRMAAAVLHAAMRRLPSSQPGAGELALGSNLIQHVTHASVLQAVEHRFHVDDLPPPRVDH